MFHRASRIVAIAALVASGLMSVAPASAQEDPLPTDLPIIFVHGGGGSAAQYRTQQMRFASNGYPNVVTAIDRADGVAANNPGFNDTFDGFIDDLLAQTGDEQVFVLAHSMGGPLMNSYLNSTPERSQRVAKYVALDTGPADCTAIPTVCTLITAAGLGDHGHTQAVTSAESFVLQYQFLTGQTPATTDVVPEAGPEISGRIVHSAGTGNWNWGPGGGTMRVFEVDSDTGHRVSQDPIATFEFTDADDGGPEQTAGAWGPITVDPNAHYEFEVMRTASDVVTHYYMQRFTRSTNLVRFLTAAPDAGTVVNTEVGPDHASIVALRYKEWWGSTPGEADSLQISATGTADDQPPVELINDATAPGPCANFAQCQTIAVHAHDAGSDGVTNTAAPIPFFFGLVFQTGVDVYMPASQPADGTIHLLHTQRGDVDRPQTLNVANWASDGHRIVVEFNDYLEAEPDEPEPPTEPTDLPIVYVHGGAGSAAQYRTQQMRFESNGYPNVITAIDRAAGVDFNPSFDDFVDDVLAQTGDDQVFVLGHSLGTTIMNGYLNSDPSRADRVAKYISLDGAPANCGSIPTECINITGIGLGGQGHTETVTSAESFVVQHEFLTGVAPATTAVVPEEGPEVSGRVINFPANDGPGQGTLDVYEIDSLTGHRAGEDPIATFEFTDADDGGTAQTAGAWGPIAVDPSKHYEFELTRAESDTTAHYYMQRFTRSSDLIRLLSAPPDAPTVVNTEVGDDHAAAVVIRYKEWWGDRPEGENDSLKISTTSTAGPFYDSGSADFPAFGDPAFPEQLPTEVINAATSPSSSFGKSIGVHLHDVGSDGTTNTAAPIPFFFAQFFQTGVDLFMPASDPVDGTIHMVSSHRGDVDRPQVINTASWPSTGHRVVVEFNDYLEEQRELPVVFVHGGSGSAAQYQSQSMRFSSNGYSGHVAAIDRNGPTAGQLDQLDDFVDDVRAQTGADQINLIGHSFGVLITNNYLSSDPARAAKVAKSIGVDSGSGPTPDVCPGNVPCKGIWGQDSPGRVGIHGPYNNVQFADQGHVQTMTSAESFAEQYRFFTGNDPATTAVVPEANPTIAGRVVQFPANLGPGEVTLNVWEVDGATGHRTSATPYATFEFDASQNGGDQSHGAWGPIPVDPAQHYELETVRAGSPITGHYYKEPFTHSNHFIRFLLLPEVALGPPLTEIGPDHSAVVALRYKEWWKSHPLTPDDSLQIGTSRPGAQQPPIEVVTDTITPVSNGTIGIHMFDVGSDEVTDLSAPIPFWFSQGFQSGADVFMPASDPPTGTVTLRSVPHDAPDRVQMLNVPNWPSDRHRSGVEFNDFAAPSETGVIEGRVLDGDGMPVEGARVRAYLISDVWVGQGFATTGPDGTYVMQVPAGQYRLLLQSPPGGGFIQQWWDGSTTRAGGAYVLVNPGGTVSGIDAELLVGGTITGTVTHVGGPIEGAQVWVYSSANSWVGTAATTTGADGTYALGGIPTGTYRVLFLPPAGSGLRLEWWDDVSQRSAGTDLSVIAGETIPDIHAQLGGP